MQLQNKVLLLVIKAQPEQWKENSWLQGFRRINFIANIKVNADFLYLYLTSGKSSRQ